MKRLILIALTVLTAGAAVNQYTGWFPGAVFARSSRIIESNGHCLRIREIRREDTHIYAPFRGRARYFRIWVDVKNESYEASFKVDGWVSNEGKGRFAQNIKKIRQHCPAESTSQGLLRIGSRDKYIRNNPKSKCGGYSRRYKLSFVNADGSGVPVRVTCMRTQFTNGRQEYFKHCRVYFLHLNWELSATVPRTKLRHWEKSMAAAKQVFQHVFEPTESCPIRIPVI